MGRFVLHVQLYLKSLSLGQRTDMRLYIKKDIERKNGTQNNDDGDG